MSESIGNNSPHDNDNGGQPVTVETILLDQSLFLEQDRWFQLLQDDGKEMTTEEYAIYQEPAKGRPKKKYKTIAHNGFFFQELYLLASEILALVERKRLSYFTRLPTSTRNMSLTIHTIGKTIALRRVSCARADIHGMGTGAASYEEQINKDEYKEKNRFYLLSQQRLLESLFEKYGVEGEKKDVTTDDKVRVAGILFNNSQLREYIPDMLGKTRGSNIRAEIDASSARKLAGFRVLYTNFIDREVIVTLPEKWTSDETKMSINSLTCDGQYEQHGTFNPNNAARIALKWTQNEVNGIFGKVVLEYQACMKKYTMGTGGGAGAPENFSTWQTRDETHVSTYIQQATNLYLAVVHIWDKQFGFPFVPKRDPMPRDCMIDDSTFGVEQADFDAEQNDDNYAGMDTPPRPTTPIPSGTRTNLAQSKTPGSMSKSYQKEKGLQNVLEKMNEGRQEVKEATREILDIMRTAGDSRSTPVSQPHEIVKQIQESMTLIEKCEKRMKTLSKRKQAINADTSTKGLKKMRTLSKSIKAEKTMIATLRDAMEYQRKILKATTKSTGETDDDSTGSSDDDTSDEDSDEVNEKNEDSEDS